MDFGQKKFVKLIYLIPRVFLAWTFFNFLVQSVFVYISELWWNPGDLTQAEDRAHRIGQTDSVTVQYLVATGTADDELWPLLQRKLNVLQQAGLSKDNFSAADSHTVTSASSSKNNQKITDYFSTSLTEEDLEALDEGWAENTME